MKMFHWIQKFFATNQFVKNPEIVDNIHFFNCLNLNRNNTGISNGNSAKVEIPSAELENEIKDSIPQDDENENF